MVELTRERKPTEVGLFIVLLPALIATGGLIGATYFDVAPIGEIILGSLGILAVSLPFRPRYPGKKVTWRVAVLALSSFVLLLFTAINVFIGKVDLAAIQYHIEFGISGFEIANVYLLAAQLGVIWVVMLISATYFFQHSRVGNWMFYGLVTVYIGANPLLLSGAQYAGHKVGILDTVERPDLAEFYTPPAASEEVRTPHNIIVIYLEGIERTYRNEDFFGDVYADIAAMEPDAVVFDNIGQVNSTSWTLAGIVAANCGVPLLRNGVFFMNSFMGLSNFLPTVVCLGDILSQAGYTQEFLLGSHPEFAGKDHFFTTHDFDRVIGRVTLSHISPEDRNEWGLFDDDLLEVAKQRIVELDAAEAPYHLEILTVGPHGPLGYLSKACRTGGRNAVTENILEAVKCTANDVAGLVAFIQTNVDMDNTLLVLLSDHLAHDNNVTGQLNRFERRNTAMFIGTGLVPQVISKEGSMLDIFPTLLDVLGVEMHGHRAGLGVSLFSDNPTLLAQFGLAGLDASLTYDRAFASDLWAE